METYIVYKHDGFSWEPAFSGSLEECQNYRHNEIEGWLRVQENEDEYFDPERDRELISARYYIEKEK
jgi:hypothetical protein